MHIGKLSGGGGLTSDTCNYGRLLAECIKEAVIQMSEDPSNAHTMEINCYHHLRYV